MKKNLFLLVALLLILFTGNALALPTLEAGYAWSGSAYWTPTDLTTVEDGSTFNLIFSESADYEADFGIYTVDDVYSPTAVDTKFEIFAHDQEPGSYKSVYFKYDSAAWSVSGDDKATWTAFDNVFGFYFDIHTGGKDDASVDYSYYSDSQFNDPASEVGIEHILIAFNGLDNIKLYLDDQINSLPADRDFNDMVVVVNDVAPVPEPGTLLLLGSGLIGLAYLKRRKS